VRDRRGREIEEEEETERRSAAVPWSRRRPFSASGGRVREREWGVGGKRGSGRESIKYLLGTVEIGGVNLDG